MGFGGGWGLDFPAPSSFYLPLLSCRSFYQDPAGTANWAGFCDHHLDNLASRAQAAQLTDPAAARRRWAQVDRIATDQAPYVPVYNDASVGLVSFRVANYQASPLYGPCSTRCGSGSRQSRCLSLRVIPRTLSVTPYGGGPAMRRARNRADRQEREPDAARTWARPGVRLRQKAEGPVQPDDRSDPYCPAWISRRLPVLTYVSSSVSETPGAHAP